MRKSFKIEYFKDDFERPAILEVFRRVQKRGTFKKSGATMPSKEF
jgi:hypothetical protein